MTNSTRRCGLVLGASVSVPYRRKFFVMAYDVNFSQNPQRGKRDGDILKMECKDCNVVFSKQYPPVRRKRRVHQCPLVACKFCEKSFSLECFKRYRKNGDCPGKKVSARSLSVHVFSPFFFFLSSFLFVTESLYINCLQSYH